METISSQCRRLVQNSFSKNYMCQKGAMLALAVATTSQLLRVGPCVFEHGGRDSIRHYVGGMQSLVHMIEKLQAGLARSGSRMAIHNI